MGDIMSTMIGPVGQLVRGGSSVMGQNIIDDDASDMEIKSSSESENMEKHCSDQNISNQ